MFKKIQSKNFINEYLKTNKVQKTIFDEVNYLVESEFNNFCLTGQRYDPYDENMAHEIERAISIYCNDDIIFRVKKENDDFFMYIHYNKMILKRNAFDSEDKLQTV